MLNPFHYVNVARDFYIVKHDYAQFFMEKKEMTPEMFSADSPAESNQAGTGID